MEPNVEEGGNKSSNNFLCRQTSSRWTPTTEQIRILKDLYYNNGVRSPTAEQIQKISARLRHFGKIEGKNVFYWFQNHKARERQKKRLSTEIPMQRAAAGVWRSEDSFYNKCPSAAFASGAPSSSLSSPAGLIPAAGQKYGYGCLAGEKNLWEYSVLPHGENGGHNFVWPGGVDPYYHPTSAAYTFLEKKKYYDDTLYEDEDEEEEEEKAPDLETLPLFPMHGDEEISGYSNGYHQYQYHHDASMACSRASLELTLNSYGCMSSPFSP